MGPVNRFTNLVTVIAHEAGHAVAAWASPTCPDLKSIRFFPDRNMAECDILPCPEPSSVEECLELAAYFLGGLAGETVAYGGFEKFTGTDLGKAIGMVAIIRRMTGRPRRERRRPNAFLTKLPKRVFSEHRGWLNRAYDLAVRRISTHEATHVRLRNLLTQGYIKGQRAWDAQELSACLGPRPA